jgi:hypothetical protein
MKQKKKRPTNDFKVTFKYIEIDEKEEEELIKYLEEWFYKVLFTGEYRKSKQKPL